MKYFDKLNHFVAIVENGIISYANPAGISMLTADESGVLADRQISDFVCPEYAEVIALGLDILADESESLPLKMMDVNGREIDARMWVGPWEHHEQDGDVFLVEIHDMTAHMLAAQTLRDREQRLTEIISSVADGIVTVDAAGDISTFNPAAGKIFGWTAAEILGTNITDLVPEVAGAIIHGQDLQSFHEIQIQRKDGDMALIEFTGRSLPQGSTSTYTWVIRDITARRQREDRERQRLQDAEEQQGIMEQQAATMVDLAEELYHLKHHAESADQLKSRFLANMSHELRTPLNAIIGFSEIMKHQMFGPVENAKYLDYSANIFDSGTYLLKLINDILDLSKIEAGSQDLFEGDVDIRSVVTDCMEMVRDRAISAQTCLLLKAPDVNPLVLADPRRIKQIILNLLTNAIKFSPSGGNINVTISTSSDTDSVSVEVMDHGKGIAAEDIELVLKPFGQVNDEISREQEGTGLGLPLCKQLMELHGGTLKLESELGKGAVVTISFPPERTINAGRYPSAAD